MTRLIVKGEDFQKKAISRPLKAIPLPVETFEFAPDRWNVRQILERRGIAEIASPLPFTATLDEVVNCAY